MHECAGVFADAMCTETNADDKTATNGGCQRRADLNNNTCMCVCVSVCLMRRCGRYILTPQSHAPAMVAQLNRMGGGRLMGGWGVSSDLKLNGMQCGAVDVAAH